MNIADIFKMAHGATNIGTWRSFGKMSDAELMKFFNSTEQMKEVLERLGLTEDGLDNLYFDPNPTLYPVSYYNKYFLQSFTALTPEIMDFTGDDKRFKYWKAKHNEAYQSGNFRELFGMMDKRIRLRAFEELYDEIPDEQKYDIFLEVYIRSEYGFENLSPDIVADAASLSHLDEEYQPFIEIKPEYVNNNGYVNIYRGASANSTPLDKAYSWTLDYEVAKFFATRFSDGKSSIIWQACVHHKDIIAYLPDRNEEEVLILPQNVLNTTKATVPSMLALSQVRKEISGKKLQELYAQYSSLLIPELFHDPHGIHGILHCRRVLFHTAALSAYLDLSREDQSILFTAAVYHDIGRTHDWEDEEHGFDSVKKMLQRGIYFNDASLTENQQITKFIIEYHCCPDNDSLEALESNTSIQNKTRATKLYRIFKDADGLDRVRLGDLDTRYLRTPQAIQLVQAAQQLLNGDTKWKRD